MTYEVEPTFKPWDGYHCSAIETEHWSRIPCPDKAVIRYVRPDSVVVAYCAKHRSLGVVEAGRNGWSVDVGEMAA